MFLASYALKVFMIHCSVQVLDPELDLRSVKHSVWRSGGDMKLFYKERKEGAADDSAIKQELPADSAEPASGGTDLEEAEGEKKAATTATTTTPDHTPSEEAIKKEDK